ncbi:MAG: GNAT family N-acetyltransferase [Bacteriovorax sp.]|nr:GNAT family N-acetyltransferase [Rhizobacter sp.]
MEPLMLDVPARIDTPRLILRCPTSADAAAQNEAVCESLAELRPYMPWAQAAPTLAQSEAECRRMHAKYLLREDLVMFMFERLDAGREGDLVGGTGLHRIDWAQRNFEIGYWCRTSRQGRGYAAEAVQALTRFAFDRLEARRVEIRMDDGNERSWRVAERAGFRLEGVLRGNRLAPGGELRDTRVYAWTQGVEGAAAAQ